MIQESSAFPLCLVKRCDSRGRRRACPVAADGCAWLSGHPRGAPLLIGRVPTGFSALNQKLAHKVFLMRAVFSQPRQGRKIVAQGASPGGGRARRPTACAVGYILSPAPRAELFNELLTQDTRWSPPTCEFLYTRAQHKVWNVLRPYLEGLFFACAARMAWVRASNSLAAAPRFISRSRRA